MLSLGGAEDNVLDYCYRGVRPIVAEPYKTMSGFTVAVCGIDIIKDGFTKAGLRAVAPQLFNEPLRMS